jgi:hypothetical protein
MLMVSIGRIDLTNDTARDEDEVMLTAPTPSRTTQPPTDPWLLWRAETPTAAGILSVAELAECRCPDLCDRDHENE